VVYGGLIYQENDRFQKINFNNECCTTTLRESGHFLDRLERVMEKHYGFEELVDIAAISYLQGYYEGSSHINARNWGDDVWREVYSMAEEEAKNILECLGVEKSN
jgi:hypothetical protein